MGEGSGDITDEVRDRLASDGEIDTEADSDSGPLLTLDSDEAVGSGADGQVGRGTSDREE